MNQYSALPVVFGLILLTACTVSPSLQVPSDDKSQAAQQVREGIIELNDGQYALARDRFETALLLEPKMAEAHYNLAVALDRLGKHAEATRHLKEAAELAPDKK